MNLKSPLHHKLKICSIVNDISPYATTNITMAVNKSKNTQVFGFLNRMLALYDAKPRQKKPRYRGTYHTARKKDLPIEIKWQ